VEFRRAAAVPAGVGNATNRSEPALERDRVRICWEGPQLVNHSLALVNRELEGALLESGQVELRILPVGANSFAGSLASKYRQLTRYYSSDNSGPVDVHVRHQWPPNWVPPSSGHFVVIQPWEFGSVPVEWLEGVNEAVDEVWAPSAFVRDLYVQSGLEAVRVHVVPNGVDTEFFKPGLKPFEIHSAKSFRFLFVGGTIHRKGADILLNAYLQSFRSSDDVTLVFKDMGTGNIYQGQGLGERIRQIQEDRGTPHIVYLDRDLSDSDMARLYNACHCLVHPYRGEGFALPVLEAMACGLPVIVTAGGATDDFVTNDTGYKIPSCKQVFGNREISGLKTAGDLWMLEPDSSALAGLLQHVFRHREEARQKGQLGRLEAQRHWTWKEAASRAVERIQALRHQPIRRFQDEADCAVLLNFQKPVSPERLRATLDSLQRNSYANLKIYLRSNETGQSFGSLAGESSALHWVNGETLSSTLRTIDRQVRAPFLALVSEPLEFSKQWFGQIAAVARQANCETVMIAPSINLRNAAHYVEYSEGDDDHSFQKFARSLWRSRRGQVEKLSDPPAGCTVVNWACVRSAVRRSFANADEWLKSLQEEGAPALWAQDTFLRWREH
jgi:glycosyltransferase involved in cell wall biosynthesis